MIIHRADPNAPASHEITPESVYLRRREFMKLGGLAAAVSALPACARDVSAVADDDSRPGWLREQLSRARDSRYAGDEGLTPYEDVSRYNNFYEFGTGKSDPVKHAHRLRTDPWTVTIAGHVKRPGDYPLEELLKGVALEERVYRLRCVEAWSMVIPWIGVPLATLLKKVEPTGDAKYLSFISLADPEQMPGVRSRFSGIDWPYREGLRLDEAMHPLTLMAVGLYGRTLPSQNGAPFRLVVPWKYGFKSIKSIVRIELTESAPQTTWTMLAPQEYGFFANVNPQVDHPRWSQARERRLPNSLLDPNWMPTRMFNGYDEVASLYSGLDLKRNF